MILPYLKTLNLEGSEVNLCQVLRRCRVESLNIGWFSSVSGLYADEISLSALKKLEMGGADVSDDELPLILQKCEKLDYLDVTCTAITGESMQHLKESLSLKTLICANNGLSNDGLLSFLSKCNKLENLDISENEELNLDLVEILQIIPGLISINASMTSITKTKSLKFYKGPRPVLTHLNLSYCEELTDSHLLDLFKFFGISLKYLNINGCNVTGRNLELSGPLPCLETLLCGRTKLEDTGVCTIIEKTRTTLRKLGVFQTEITEGCREAINREYPSLILDRNYTLDELMLL